MFRISLPIVRKLTQCKKCFHHNTFSFSRKDESQARRSVVQQMDGERVVRDQIALFYTHDNDLSRGRKKVASAPYFTVKKSTL